MKKNVKRAITQAQRKLPSPLWGGAKGWSALYGKDISNEEYTKLRDNLSGFFDTLNKWSNN